MAAGATCTVSVDVTGTASGTHVNTSGDLTSSSGNSGSAGDTLVVGVEPGTTCFTDTTGNGSGDATFCFTGDGAGCGFSSVAYIPVEGDPLSPPAGTAPAGLVFPHGLVTFTIDSCTPGFTAVLTLDLPLGLPPDTEYWKYGPTSADPTPHWYELPAVFTGNTVTFSITDGGLGDDDLVANGTIIDQGGPAAPAGAGPAVEQIPTLSEWSLLLLAALLVLAGAYQLRRRLSV